MEDREGAVLEEAKRLGFALVGVASAHPSDGFDRLEAWLAAGYAGEMQYMQNTAEMRRDPRAVYPPVRSVIVVGMSYAPGGDEVAGGVGRIARYAQVPDYHGEVRRRLKELGAWMKERWPDCWGRTCVDTAPLLERDFGRRAGLGWFGKNTMLIDKRHGSWFVIGALLTDLELKPTGAFEGRHCGTCTACLDACPTGAFVGPFVLDARKCISYLTIEMKGRVEEGLRAGLGDWLYGCDVCQEVCPWNRKAPVGELRPMDRLEGVDAVELLGLDEEGFRMRFAGTALHPRPGRAVVLRNAALVLGNVGGEEALPALRRALEDVPLVREAAEWALERIEARGSGSSSEEPDTRQHQADQGEAGGPPPNR